MGFGNTNAAAGGTSLNFKVVGGTTEPTNPKENMIWVNTSNKITGWYFSYKQPESMVEGEVWFATTDSSEVAFNALKKNTIQVYPSSVKQWVSGELKDVTAKSYQNGAWVDWWNGVLHENGDGYENITGGWQNLGKIYSGSTEDGKPLTLSNITGGIKLSQSHDGASGLYVTKNKISLDNYSSVRFTGKIYRDSTYKNDIGIVVLSAIGNSIEDNAVAKYVSPVGTKNYNDQSVLNITDLKGSYYIGFYINSTDGKYIELKKLRLE